MSDAELAELGDNIVDPYLEKIGKRSGAHAILMTFHHGRFVAPVTNDQICEIVKRLNLCDSEMEANYHQGRMYGAWKAKDTLVSHGFLQEHKTGVSYTGGGFRSNGKHRYSITGEILLFKVGVKLLL
jgi:hypothetical protein